MKSKTTIEVNGIRYDAKTGAKLGTGHSPHHLEGKNIDGFFRGRSSSAQVGIKHNVFTVAPPPSVSAPYSGNQTKRNTNHVQAHSPQPAIVIAKPAVIAHKPLKQVPVPKHSNTPNHVSHRTPQPSVTLMRKAVQRPSPSFHKQVGTKGSLQHAVPSLITTKPSAHGVDINRYTRAKEILRSPHISHHVSTTKESFAMSLTPLAVQPVPVKPEAHEPQNTPIPKPTNRPADNIFEHAIANAAHYTDVKSHSRSFKKHSRNHILSMTAGTFALVLIAGFATYQNTPGVQFKVASVKAGVSTHMPNLKAAGFAFRGVKSNDGKLTVGFNGTNGAYELTQQSTNWSNTDMIEHVGATDASGRPTYKSVQTGKTTVYRFSNTDATWVQNGTWYSVSGTSSLSDQQVAKLVQNI